jgi:diguanylate cyclase (GGDEF)-like protein/PAS domain S-box-containing protein
MSPETSPPLARRITNNEPRDRADSQNPIRGPFARTLEASPSAVAARHLSRTALVRALDMTPDAVFFFTPDLQIVDANAAAVGGTGYRRGELQALRLDDVLADDGQGSWHTGILRVLRGESLEQGLPALQRSKNGDTSPVRFEVELIRDGDGPLLVAVVHCRRDERDAHELLARARHFDYLTELPTRVALEYRLRRAERQARRQRTRFAVLFLDFDRFKEVNDRHGHRVGDAVLRAFARRLNACVRPGDFIARYGGDEFVVLVEDVLAEGELERMAERIRTESGVSLEIGDTTISIAVSVGVAIGHAGSSAAALVDEADRAMYASKRACR